MSRYFYHKLDFARALVEILPPHQWSVAYPGNSPDIAQEGVDTFKKAVADNMHMIYAATSSEAKK